ncbi:MAG: hypothetical protein PUC06_05175 [Oscillospiraceae bacterium]|nr:hypothetical protein [Oscillospiraceae bacterium]
MKIGEMLHTRMNQLGYTSRSLAVKAFVGESLINDLLANNIEIDQVDELDVGLLCSALHCNKLYFSDEEVRMRDLLVAAQNAKEDDESANLVKARMQDYINDFDLICDISDNKTRKV